MDIYGLNIQRIYIFYWHWLHQFFIWGPRLRAPYIDKKNKNNKSKNNLKTINSKISMLVHTFCAPPPAIQQQKPSSGAKKLYSTKLKMFLFHSSKIEGPK